MQVTMAFLQSVLYAISACLLCPVMLGLVVLCAWAIVYAGGFLAEWIARSSRRKRLDIASEMNEIHRQRKAPAAVFAALSDPARRYLVRFAALTDARDPFFAEKVESLIQTTEHDLGRHVDRLRLVVRVGPSLGLMGTLIPMATGLTALSQGNLSAVSSSLVIAFTTTVVGLAVGVLAQAFAIAKSRWVQEDIRAIELVTEALMREPTP
ncbi:MAG: MotA/TolQ/ExbB proton channel family protein [Verrucomicrobiota bacterium]|nr:MotA/TolQ/ExbB proton channel family protein [Verrucomicrobiota bacterium]